MLRFSKNFYQYLLQDLKRVVAFCAALLYCPISIIYFISTSTIFADILAKIALPGVMYLLGSIMTNIPWYLLLIIVWLPPWVGYLSIFVGFVSMMTL
jgi:hypothetical protein